jgi:formiminoglutamate deiminase
MSQWWAELAWLGGDEVAEAVLLTVEGDRLAGVEPGRPAPPSARRLAGLVLPGLVNAHSHAFHRALRGRTHAGAGDFWAWRERMYELAGRLEPGTYQTLATAVYAEMALAGITTVAEFHYLHHPARPSGGRYADPNELGLALVAAAAEAGVRLTLLDTCYLRAGPDGAPLAGVQARFGDGDADAWAERAAALHLGAKGEAVRVGAAIHSVRAVPPKAMTTVAGWAGELGVPLHLHLAEQRREVADCLAATGRTPAGLCADTGVLGPATTAVHATHLTDDDVALLGGHGVTACICPTTERDLADGVGPAARLAQAGAPLALGSDSHAVIDLFEEARAVELDERLVSGRRGLHRPAALLAAATAGGAGSAGWPEAGALAKGRLADFVAVRLDGPRLAGTDPAQVVPAVVFGAGAADVTDVVVGGRPVVAGGWHLGVGDVGRALAVAIGAVSG